MSSGPTRYYLYIPVWATGTPPQGGGSSELSESSGSQSGTGGGPGQTDPPSSAASSMPMSETEGPPSTELPSGFTNESSGGATTGSGSVPPSGTAGGSSGGGFSGSGGTGPGGTEPGGTGSGGTGPGGTSPGGTGPGGTGPGGSGPGGTGPGGTGPGGTGPGGGGPGSSGGGSGTEGTGPGGSSGNCLLFGTLVRLADGRLTPIENLKPGDLVASVRIPGLEVDVPYRAQYDWLSHHGLHDAEQVSARVASIVLGEHHGFVVINQRIKATREHPILVRRGDQWGFASAGFVLPGDCLIDDQFNEEPVQTVVRVDAPTRTVAIHIPGTNTLLAEGIWVHNDRPTASTSGSGSDESSKTSGSSSFSSSGSSSSSSSSAPGFSASLSGSTVEIEPGSSGSFVSFGE